MASMKSMKEHSESLLDSNVKKFYISMDFKKVVNYHLNDPELYPLETMMNIHGGKHSIINMSTNVSVHSNVCVTSKDSDQPAQLIYFLVLDDNMIKEMSRNMRFPTMWYVCPAKPQISLSIRAAFASCLNII